MSHAKKLDRRAASSEEEDSYASYDSYSGGGDASEEDLETQAAVQQQTELQAKQQQEAWDAPTTRKMDHAYFTVDHTFTPEQLFAQGKLLNDGAITLSVNKGIRLGRHSNKADFAPGRSQAARNRDIVQKATVDITASWKREMDFSCPTIPAYKEEGYPGTGECVCESLVAGDLKPGHKHSFVLLERDVTHGSLLFQEQFPCVDPDTFHKEISYTKNYAVMPLHFPTVLYFNQDQTDPAKQLTKLSAGYDATHNEVRMPLADAQKYTEIARTKMQNRISYANITGGLQMHFSVPVPADRAKDHALWLKSDGKKGRQWLGFADAAYALAAEGLDPRALHANGSGLSNADVYMKTPQHISLKSRFDYLHTASVAGEQPKL